MSPKRKQDDDKSNKRNKRVTRKRTVSTKPKGKAKKNKALPKVKYSFVVQMASVEKEMMD